MMRLLPRTLSGRIALLVIFIFLANIVLTWIFSVQYAKKIQMRETIATCRAIISHLDRTESIVDISEFIEPYDIVQRKRQPKNLSPAPYTLLRTMADRYNRKKDHHIEFYVSDEQPDYIWLHYKNLNDKFETWLGIQKTAFYEDHPFYVFSQEMIIVAMIIIGSLLTARSITRPIERISQATRDFASGMKPNKIPERGTREVKQLARAFNKMLDDHAELEAERQLMLAGFSHDIRTPLTRLQLGLDLLPNIDTQSRNELKADIAQITAMQKQFMDYVTAGAAEPITEVDLNELCHQTKSRYQNLIKEDIQLVLPSHPVIINGQALNLSRVMCNLLMNAIKYGKAPVCIKVEDNEEQVIIQVCDQGDGVSEKDLVEIFKPMYRSESCRKNADGAGLGLAIVKRIIEQHKGHIVAENTTPGFCMTITLIKRS